jgi:hypothetical protein
VIPAWLCRTAQFAAADTLKSQRRRQQREQELHMQSQIESIDEPWLEISPLLDNAMAQLGEKDHAAIVLRFFKDKDLKQVGAALGVSENAAKTRVSRAIEKLRNFLLKRGVTVSAVALGATLSAHSVQAAPIGLATSVTVAAMNGATVTTSTLILIKSTLKLMAWTKIKTVAVVSAVALLAVGTATMALHSDEPPKAGGAQNTRGRFAFAGFATPEDAQKTLVWACSTGEIQKVLEACTAEQGGRFKQKTIGTPAAEVKRRLIEEAANRANYEITQQEKISNEEVRLHLLVQPYPGHPNVGNDIQVMRKVGNDWKYAGKWGVDIKE